MFNIIMVKNLSDEELKRRVRRNKEVGKQDARALGMALEYVERKKAN